MTDDQLALLVGLEGCKRAQSVCVCPRWVLQPLQQSLLQQNSTTCPCASYVELAISTTNDLRHAWYPEHKQKLSIASWSALYGPRDLVHVTGQKAGIFKKLAICSCISETCSHFDWRLSKTEYAIPRPDRTAQILIPSSLTAQSQSLTWPCLCLQNMFASSSGQLGKRLNAWVSSTVLYLTSIIYAAAALINFFGCLWYWVARREGLANSWLTDVGELHLLTTSHPRAASGCRGSLYDA